MVREDDAGWGSTLAQLHDAANLIVRRAAGTFTVMLLLAFFGGTLAVLMGDQWRAYDPDQMAPVVLAAAAIALGAAFRASWRPMVSAAFGGGVATVAWITAVMQDFSTSGAVSRSWVWIYSTIFLSVVWVLILRPLAQQERMRVDDRRELDLQEAIAEAVAAQVRSVLDERRTESIEALPPTIGTGQ